MKEQGMSYDPEVECQKVVCRIKELCKSKKLSFKAVAKKAELAQSTLSEIVNGNTHPQIYSLFKICNALEIPIQLLFSESKLDDSVCIGEKEILQIYQELTKEKQELLKNYIELLLKI